jgi:putative ABC transport system permease protein
MNWLTLLRRSLRFHARPHVGVVLGAATATAILTGALVVGDSVKGSLRDQALRRLGPVTAALDAHDRFFTDQLGGPESQWTRVLRLPGLAVRQDGTARANRIEVLGIGPEFTRLADRSEAGVPAPDAVWLNAALAQRLNARVGETVVLRIHKPGALSLDAVITPRDDTSVALRLEVTRILSGAELGDFSLQAGAAGTLNAFVSAPALAKAAGLVGRANLAVTTAADPAAATPTLDSTATLADFELTLQARAPVLPTGPAVPRPGGGRAPGAEPFVELSSRRIFLETAAAEAAARVPGGVPLLTYLVNGLAAGGKLAPYSMVTAAGAPYTPAELRDDEIVINDWLANDLGVKPGDALTLTYYQADSGAQLAEATNVFRVHSIVPLQGVQGDRTLMPEFPGLAKAESTHDWDAGFELVHKIRDQDERYWKEHRGTPKAFVTLATGQRLWGNRFGELTAVRWFAPSLAEASQRLPALSAPLRAGLKPSDFGLRFEPVRAQALSAAAGGTAQDFGGLFIGFSFFLITSAVLLTSLLFRFGLEQRATEIGTLLALGWPVRRVRSLFLSEGMLLAGLGAVLGGVAGPAYGWAVLRGLNTLWTDAVAGAALEFHLTAASLAGGMVGGLLVAGGTLWLALRSLVSRPARELLNEGAQARAWTVGVRGTPGLVGRLLPGLLGIAGIGLAVFGTRLAEADRPGAFFGASALLLLAGLTALRRIWRQPRPVAHLTRSAFAWRAPARRPDRSLATVALLGCATFLLAAVAAYRLDATRDATQRGSGTGGFAFWAETALPVLRDLNTREGLEEFGLDARSLPGVNVVPLRVRNGEEASCLNLNRPGKPRLLGVNPTALASRGAFTFKRLADGLTVTNGWDALRGPADAVEIPAIGDDASIQWALKSKVGGTLDFTDDQGRPFRLRLVGAVANSVLQGNLLIDATAFTHRFPNEAGYRAFLVDAPPATARESAATLTKALQDVGFETVPMADRLARFHAVQNTYLNTFQVLGGLGLLLGSLGLGVVVLRNVYERRAELAVLAAVGFEPGLIRRLVLIEHALLVLLGLGLGTGAAGLALFPTFNGPELPWRGLLLTLLAVAFNGLLCAALATRQACRGSTLAALRGE